MLKRLLIVAALLIPALLCAQAPTPGEQLVAQSRKNLEDLKSIGKSLDLVEARIARYEILSAQDKKPAHGMGYKKPSDEVSRQRHAKSDALYGKKLADYHKMMALVTLPAAYDARNQWKLPGIDDQGDCGDCYWWSGIRAWYIAQVVSGRIKAADVSPTIKGTVQYGLDYYPEQGGCDGGDEYPCAAISLSKGFPLPGNYPGNGQGQGNKQPVTGTTLTIDSMMFCTVGAGPNSPLVVNDVKVCLMKYGPVSFAAAASSWGDGTGVNTSNDNQVNHAITIYGWDDSKGPKGAWLVHNQWSTNWGNQGYMWLGYGACGACEGFVCIVNPVTPPPPPDPIPGGNTTLTLKDLTPAQVADILAQLGGTTPSNGVVITTDMTVQQMIDALTKQKAVKK